MWKILTSKADIEDANQKLKRAFESRQPQYLFTTIGYQSNNFPTTVMWLSGLDIWAYFGLPPNGKSKGKRYWNVFGIGMPKKMVSIVCEINSPMEGINRRVAGAFARNDEGDIAVMHRGRINVTRGITKELFRRMCRCKWENVVDAGKNSSLVYIGNLSSLNLVESIRDFVFEIDRIKNLVRR